MKRNLTWLGVFVMAMSMVLVVQPLSAMTLSGFTITLGCTSYGWTFTSWTADRDNTDSSDETGYVQVTDGAGKVLLQFNTTYEIGSGVFGGGTASYSSLPDYNPLTYTWISNAGNGFDEHVVYTTTGTCAGLPSFVMPGLPNKPLPGPDMVLIPDTAVVGTFTAWTPLYFTPHSDGASPHAMTPGQSVYVFGLDATGQFYQVLLSGNLYWAPVGNLGPNFDDVWRGTPLPTHVIG